MYLQLRYKQVGALDMLKIVFLVTVAAITILPICEVETSTWNEEDIHSIIKLLLKNNYLQQKTKDASRETIEIRAKNNKHNNHYGSLTSGEIAKLIQKVTLDKNKNDKAVINTKVKSKGSSYQTAQDYHMSQDYDVFSEKKLPAAHADEKKALHNLFSHFFDYEYSHQNNRDKNRYLSKKIRKGSKENKIRVDNISNLDDYSKVYVILNPSAIRQSKSQDSLSNLVVKTLSSSILNADSKKEEYHKGFPVKSDLFSRRSRRDSRESFRPMDSIEDHKPKRPRSQYSGGGAGGSGRTAIPYASHRGDIYEKVD